MPKVIDDHRERAFRSYISKRTTKAHTSFLMGRLGISRATAGKYLHHPESMRVEDLVRLGFTDEELLGVIK